MKKTILKTRGLCKTFINGKTQSNVIRNMDLEIFEGDFTVIMGASGSGKSTLLYCLSGIDSVTSGEVLLNDAVISNLKEKDMVDIRRKDIGFIFQEPNLIDDFSVFENIALSGYLTNKDRNAVNEDATELLKSIDMLDHGKKYTTELSGGQKQKVSIARSLINKPQIVFADEPTGSLNANQSSLVLDLISKINENGQSILMVTHDIRAAARANRLLYIKDGKIDGILDMETFNAGDVQRREKQVFDFVIEKGW